MKFSLEFSLGGKKSTTPQDEALRRAFPQYYTRPEDINVTEDSANTLSAVFACRRILAETLAATPMILYKDRKIGDKKAGKDRAVDHPLYHVLHGSWNKYVPAFAAKEAMMWDLTGSGNAYALKLFAPDGRLTGLQHVPAWDMEIRQTEDKKSFYYRRASTNKDHAWDEVLHIPATTKDGIHGMSPIAVAMETIGLGLAAQQYKKYRKVPTSTGNSLFFRRGPPTYPDVFLWFLLAGNRIVAQELNAESRIRVIMGFRAY